MTANGWIQILVYLAVILAITRPLGRFMRRVYEGERTWGDVVLRPVERLLYRVTGVDETREMRWAEYAVSVLIFGFVSVVVLYALQRLQGWLPLNPQGFGPVPTALAFNTAASFSTNTNWQAYGGESTMSYLTQMAGLAYQNFMSAATGMAVAAAVIRGIARRESQTIGNFWVDLTRSVLWILLPVSFVGALALVSQGVPQNFRPYDTASLVDAQAVTSTPVDGTSGKAGAETTKAVARQMIAQGPVASQEIIKQFGTNGGGFFNANAAHPFESPNGFTHAFHIFLMIVIPFSLAYTFGKLVKDTKQGWTVFAAMFVLWFAAAGIAMGFEAAGNPRLDDVGVTQAATAQQSGGNLEGKETRVGSAACGLYAASSTGTSTGAVGCTHDSMTPVGGGTALLNMMLGEVSPGGVGAGLYGILVFALLAVFIAGLMVGRTPEFLGKKIQAAEMKLVVLYILAVPVVILGFTAASVLLDTAKASILNPGAHGLTEVTYAFTSAANNNGSAFAGLSGNTDWYNTTLGLSMLVGRFLLIVPILAIAGALARKQASPPTAGTFPTNTPLFTVLLVGVIVLVVGLTFFPVLALGPIAEALSL